MAKQNESDKLYELESNKYKEQTESEVKNSGFPGDRYILKKDDTNILMENLCFVRNQLYQEILESYGIDLADIDEDGKKSKIDELVDSDPSYSIKYDNEAYVAQETAYVENKLGVVPNLNSIKSNKSIGDLIISMIKNGTFSTESQEQQLLDLLITGPVDMSKVKGWDVDKAVTFLTVHAKSPQQKKIEKDQGKGGECAKYVRMAIEAGGISTAGRPIAAKDYVNFLPKIGFGHYRTIKGKAAYSRLMGGYIVKGDIAVYPRPGGGYGHICMFNGKVWISDFVQPSAWVYGSNNVGTMYLFRFKGVSEVMKEGGITGGINLNLSPGGKMAGAARHTNNPGNITGSGYYGCTGTYGSHEFAIFPNVVLGIRAWFSWINRWITKRGKNTLRLLWYIYAPPSENDTKAYIAAICKKTGLGPDTPLPPVHANKNLYWIFARACFKFECSYSPPDNILEEAWKMYMQNPNLA